MADESVRVWAQALVQHELQGFERARRRFVRHATPKRLHDVRTAARRLRSLAEDFSDVVALEHLKCLRHALETTGEARDCDVLRRMLCRVADDGDDCDVLHALLRDFRTRERHATRHARTSLRRLRLHLL